MVLSGTELSHYVFMGKLIIPRPAGSHGGDRLQVLDFRGNFCHGDEEIVDFCATISFDSILHRQPCRFKATDLAVQTLSFFLKCLLNQKGTMEYFAWGLHLKMAHRRDKSSSGM